ncbi:hypothetical protein GCM10009550_73220 [Actinocorallia libanotica]|uniref:Transposase IS4-like domain-containing protein n=1 Tax=Actinocorallia libanotica TaxID=46162 RepID=A0ABP4CG63_9ACTN
MKLHRRRLHHTTWIAVAIAQAGKSASVRPEPAVADLGVNAAQDAGPNPVDRGEKGSKLHFVYDGEDLPLAVLVTGEDVHDIQGFKPLIEAIPPVRSRRGPRRRRPDKVRADKAYEAADLRRWLRKRGITPRIQSLIVRGRRRRRRTWRRT